MQCTIFNRKIVHSKSSSPDIIPSFISFYFYLQVLDEVLLAKKLNESVFGQALAIEILNRVLMASVDYDGLVGGQQQQKPKALLLFGWTGTGKSFVTRLIEEAFVLKANIHRFSVPLHLSSAANH